MSAPARKRVMVGCGTPVRRSSSTSAPKSVKVHRPAETISQELFERTVMLKQEAGMAEVVFVAETPELAKAFAAGFNARASWSCELDTDLAKIGSEVLLDMLSPEHWDLEAKGGAA